MAIYGAVRLKRQDQRRRKKKTAAGKSVWEKKGVSSQQEDAVPLKGWGGGKRQN